MMLKVLVYAYIDKVYTSRRIAKALRENVNYMWLAGNNQPGFRTIARFRAEVLQGKIRTLLAEILGLLAEMGYVSMDDYSIDGTKIEADANAQKMVWGKKVMNSKARLLERIEGLLTAIEEANRAEDEAYGDRDLEEPGGSAEIDAERLQETIAHRSQNGYLSERRIYESHHRTDCPLKPNCTQAHGNRRSKVSLALRRYRQQARDNLLSEHGTRLRKQRGTVLEGIIGNIKHNLGFRYYACFFALLTQLHSIAHEYKDRVLSFVLSRDAYLC